MSGGPDSLARRREGRFEVSEKGSAATGGIGGAASPFRARVGMTAIFLANGLAIAAWAATIPQVKVLFALSDGRLSLILLAVGLGAIAATPAAGLLPPRTGGTGRTLRLSGCCPRHTCGVACYDLSACAGRQARCLRVPVRLLEHPCRVPMNAHASVIERAWGRAIMSSFHAAWSAGGLIASAIGGLLIACGASPATELGVEAALCFLLAA